MKNKSFPSLDKVVRITLAARHAEHVNIELFNTCCKILSAFEGKEMDTRTRNRMVKAFETHFGPGTYCVMDNFAIGIPSISLYGPTVPGHINYEKRFHFFLPCHDKRFQPFTVENLRADNGCYGEPAKIRNNTRTNCLNVEGKSDGGSKPLRRTAIAVDNFLAARAELVEALAEIEDKHAVIREFGLDKEVL